MSVRTFLLCIMLIFYSTKSLEPAEDTVPDQLNTFHPDVEALLAKTIDFSTKGYSQEADTLARQITSEIIHLPIDGEISLNETKALLNAFLKTELYYAFNTKWGSGKTRDPRIVYDFLSQLNKSAVSSAPQREYLTKLTVLSLAAQEYFWNEKSTVNDLRNRVKRELRYELFSQPGHILDISMLIYLDSTNLHTAIENNITNDFINGVKSLMEGFRMKTLGTTYAVILDYINATSKPIEMVNLPIDIASKDIFVPTGFSSSLELKAISSFGDGMCGQHSLFIPTDGDLVSAEGGIVEGNGRYKMSRAILDNATDEDAKRLYLRSSQYMDGLHFIDLINKQITMLSETNPAQAQALQEKLDTYKAFMHDKQAESETIAEQSKHVLLETIIRLSGLETALNAFQAKLKDPEQLSASIVNRNFSNIIDEIIALRSSTPELDSLLITIDSDIARLNAEIEETKKTAIETAKKARAKIEKDFQSLAEDFQQFQIQNIELVKQHQILFSRQQQFTALIQRGVVIENAEKIQTNIEQQFKEFEEKNPEFVRSINEKSTALQAMQKTYQTLKEDLSIPDAKLAEKYTLICTTLQDFIGNSMLPGKSSTAFSIDSLCTKGYSNFVNGICQEICTLINDKETAIACRQAWDTFDNQKEAITHEIEQQLLSQRLEIAASFPSIPEELTPHSLSLEMSEIALREGELGGWLPCDAIYTQLWAIINNLNIFVFSEGEQFGRSKLDLMIRLVDRRYTQETTLYPANTTGKRLATVILTSPTAKNIFLDKSLQHYDKFILPDDYAAIAKQMRHVGWVGLADERYAAYPQKAY